MARRIAEEFLRAGVSGLYDRRLGARTRIHIVYNVRLMRHVHKTGIMGKPVLYLGYMEIAPPGHRSPVVGFAPITGSLSTS